MKKKHLKITTIILTTTLLITTGLTHSPDEHAEDQSFIEMFEDAADESQLSILVISLTIIIMLTSIYFIGKILIKEWRWIEDDI